MINKKAFVLLYAVLLVSIVLTVSLSLFDISYRQIILSSTVESSQLSFYVTDGVRDCIRYYDSNIAPKEFTPAETGIWRYFGRRLADNSGFEFPPVLDLIYNSIYYLLDCGANKYQDNSYYNDSSSNERISTLDFDFGNNSTVNVKVNKKINQGGVRPVVDEFVVTGTYGTGARQVQTSITSKTK